jgi:hypothetical protein
MSSEAPLFLLLLSHVLPLLLHTPTQQGGQLSPAASTHSVFPRRYLADPPLLELDGNSVSASPAALPPPSEPLPAAVVPAGIVAQRRKSFADHAAAAVHQRPSFAPEAHADIVTSAGYVKSIVTSVQTTRSSAGDAGVFASATAPASAFFSFAEGGAVDLAHPSASEPSSNLAPPPNLYVLAGFQSSKNLQNFDVLQQPHAEDASPPDSDVSQSQVGILPGSCSA